MDLARHMGAQLPPRLELAGTIDGAAGLRRRLAGRTGLPRHRRDHSRTRRPSASSRPALVFDGASARADPRRGAAGQRRRGADRGRLRLGHRRSTSPISTGAMNVAALRVAGGAGRRALAGPGGLGHLERAAALPVGPAAGSRARGAGAGKSNWKMPNSRWPAWPSRCASTAARAQIEGPRLVLDRMRARVGRTDRSRASTATNRGSCARTASAWPSGKPTRRRSKACSCPRWPRRSGLLVRAWNFGRAPLPEWLATRRMEGTLQIGSLALGDTKHRAAQGAGDLGRHARPAAGVSGRVEDGAVTGILTASLRGPKPVYLLSGRLKTVNCRSGKVDAEGVVETRGTGRELLANLRSQGVFTGRGLEVGALPGAEERFGNLPAGVGHARAAAALSGPGAGSGRRRLHGPRRHPGRRPAADRDCPAETRRCA